jgi:hypothetical protein
MTWQGRIVWDDSDDQEWEETGVIDRGDVEDTVNESEAQEYEDEGDN